MRTISRTPEQEMRDDQMERASRQITQYAAEPEAKWPTKLMRAEEVAGELLISAERLLDLAAGGFAPHWRIDGGEPLFRVQELKDWGVRNLASHCRGRPIPIEIRVNLGGGSECPAIDAPASIRDIPDLMEIPTGFPSGVYFLVRDNEVVYVGQSINPASRVVGHLASKKRFNRVYLMPVPPSRLDDVEAAMIRLLSPRFNRAVRGIGTLQDDDCRVVEEFWPGVRDLASIFSIRHKEKRDASHAAWVARSQKEVG